MTDVVLSEAAKSLTPLVPHDVAEDTNSATIVSSSSSSSNRHSKNMKSRVRKVRGSSQKVGQERLQRAGNAVEDKPQYKNYLAEQRARRLQRFKSKGKYEGLINDDADQVIQRDDDDNEIKAIDNGSGDSGRGVSAGSSGSKDEGIHSTGEKDEELEPESNTNKIESVRAATEGVGEDDDDEGRGSINGDEEHEEGPTSPTGEADDEASTHSDADGKEEPADDAELDANGYHGDMDEPNSLANSYQDSFGVSSDAGLGTTYELTLLRSGLEDMFGNNENKEKEDENSDGKQEEGGGEKEEEKEGGEQEDEQELEDKLHIKENGSDGNESKEEESDADKMEEDDKEDMEEVDTGDTKEEDNHVDAEQRMNDIKEEDKEDMEEVDSGDMKEEDNDVDAEQRMMNNIKEEDKEEIEEADAGDTKEEDNDVDAEMTMNDIKEEEEETEDKGEVNEWTEQEKEEAKYSENENQDDVGPDDANKETTDADNGNEADEEDDENTTSDKEEEEEEAEKEEENSEEEAAPLALEYGEEEEVEALEKIDEGEEAEHQSESEKEETEEEKEDNEEEDDRSQGADEAIDNGTAEVEKSIATGETEEGQEKLEGEEETKEEEANETEEHEEEIQEVPAIAKIPGRYRRRNVPGKIAPSAKKSAGSKAIDVNKVASTRKPISYRSGPIQTSSRPEAHRSINGRQPRRNFKAKSMQRKVAEDKSDDAIKENDEENDEGDSQASQDDRRSSIADSEPQDMPPVNLSTLGENDILGALETSRSVEQLSQTDSQEEDSLMDSNFQDISRPRTAGKKYSESKPTARRGVVSKVSTSRKSSVSQPRKTSSTSEVWVPEEDKLYVYTYSSQPRLLQVRRMGARVATTDKWDNDPNSSFKLKIRGNGNPMYDRRVVRGSNYGKRIEGDDLPKWNPYFSNARSLTQVNGPQNETTVPTTELSQSQQLRRQEFRQKLEARARMRRETHGVYPSHNGNANNYHRNYARAHVHVQTENYYEPLERPPESDTGIQTDPWSEEGGFVAPAVAHTVPGVDAATQVYDAELDANTDDDVLLAALVGRTMREAVFEVAHEEQAEEMRINILATAALSSFLKPGEAQGNGDGDEEKDDVSGDKANSDEREEPEGKETTPEGTLEVARTPDITSPSPKDIDNVTEGQENKSLVQ